MKTLLIPGVLGLLLGLTMHWTQLSQPWRWTRAAFLSGVTALSGLSLRPVEALCMLIGCGVGSLLQGDVASMHASAEAVLADLPMLPVWLGAICVVTGMIGVLVGWRRLRV